MKPNTLTFRHIFKSGASCTLVVDPDVVKGAPFILEAITYGDADAMRETADALAAIERLFSSELDSNRAPLKGDGPEARVWIRSVIERCCASR